MLVWSRLGRVAVWSVAALLIGIVFIAPLAVILAASFATQWNGVLPTGFTFDHYLEARGGASGEAIFASLVTGVVASSGGARKRRLGGAGPSGARRGVEPIDRPALLRSERGSLSFGWPRPPRRVQPAAAASERKERPPLSFLPTSC